MESSNLIGVHRIEFPSAEDLLEAVKSLTITYKKHMSAGPKLSDNPGPTPKNLLDDEDIHEEKNAIAKEILLEHEEDTKSFLDKAVKDADMLVGNDGIPDLEVGPDKLQHDPLGDYGRLCKNHHLVLC